MQRIRIITAVLSLTIFVVLGFTGSPVQQPQSAASLTARVVALETTVALQQECNADIAARIEALEQVVGITPSPTPAPTDTPRSTATRTPTPTATIPPGELSKAASCEEILQVWRAGPTERFLELRRNEVIGKWLVEWEGMVQAIHSEPTFLNPDPYVTIENPINVCTVYLYPENATELSQYSVGQTYRVTGQVENITIVFGYLGFFLVEDTIQLEEVE